MLGRVGTAGKHLNCIVLTAEGRRGRGAERNIPNSFSVFSSPLLPIPPAPLLILGDANWMLSNLDRGIQCCHGCQIFRIGSSLNITAALRPNPLLKADCSSVCFICFNFNLRSGIFETSIEILTELAEGCT